MGELETVVWCFLGSPYLGDTSPIWGTPGDPRARPGPFSLRDQTHEPDLGPTHAQ